MDYLRIEVRGADAMQAEAIGKRIVSILGSHEPFMLAMSELAIELVESQNFNAIEWHTRLQHTSCPYLVLTGPASLLDVYEKMVREQLAENGVKWEIISFVAR